MKKESNGPAVDLGKLHVGVVSGGKLSIEVISHNVELMACISTPLKGACAAITKLYGEVHYLLEQRYDLVGAESRLALHDLALRLSTWRRELESISEPIENQQNLPGFTE